MKGILDNLPMEELLKILERNIKSQSSIPCITSNSDNIRYDKSYIIN